MSRQSPHLISRIIFIILGFLCLGLAVLGFALPGLPGTPFLLLAAACFSRSSPRLHGWLVRDKFFGPLISNWQESRSIPRRIKRIALLTICVTAAFSLYTLGNLYLKMALIAVLIIPVVILVRLQETEALQPAKSDNDI